MTHPMQPPSATTRRTPTTVSSHIARALAATLISPNEFDSNCEPANVVDGLFAIARALLQVAVAIERRDPEETR